MQTTPAAVRHLVHRLSGAGALRPDDVETLSNLVGHPKEFARGAVLVEQTAQDPLIWLISTGWAVRQKMLHDGRRQIIAIMLPGELSEKGPMMAFGAPDAVVALSNVVAHPINRNAIVAALRDNPSLLYAFFFEELTRHAITREWLLLLSKRNAVERLAYFLCEMFARLRAMGFIEGRSFEIPLIQEDVADLLGMSNVHLNRTLQTLRRQRYVVWEGQTVTLPDPVALAQVAAFNPDFIRIAEEFATRAHASREAKDVGLKVS